MSIFKIISQKFVRAKIKSEYHFIELHNDDVKISVGSWCPNCKNDGAAFLNDIDDYKFYICENCLKNWEYDEYKMLLKKAQRKQKLQNINNNKTC